MIGTKLNQYRILEKIGQGGMGEVYLAVDEQLNRKAALKFLAEPSRGQSAAKQRFLREARSAAALDHPFICKIYEVSQCEGLDFISMEYVEGETLSSLLAQGRLPLTQSLQIFSEMTEALGRAHEKGVIHRDLKPANIMVTADNHIKILDFGLAKPVPVDEVTEDQPTALELTREGSTLGTIPYMSPEQLRGESVDCRSDLFSLGIIFYELLTGCHPYRRASVLETAHAILNKSPEPLDKHPEANLRPFHAILGRLLAPNKEQRYTSAGELSGDLARIRTGTREVKSGLFFRKPAYIIGLIVVLALLTGGASWLWYRQTRISRVYDETLPRVEELLARRQFFVAYRLLREAQTVVPHEAKIADLIEGCSLPVSVSASADGTEVFYKDYEDPDAPWIRLGTTPLGEVRIPVGFVRWRTTKAGFQPLEQSFFSWGTSELNFELVPSSEARTGMIRVPARSYSGRGLEGVEIPKYWLDQYEVTNLEFKGFVDAGAYRRPDHWNHTFSREGRTLTWQEAMAEFKDVTGQPGPSGWKLGTFQPGQESMPVSGVSWYEAAAYCEFAGKSLPTIHHWFSAVPTGSYTPLYLFSNFDNDGPVAVGSRFSMGTFGTYDQAGNVNEWTYNDSGSGDRYILGGSWGDPPYTFSHEDSRDPFVRNETYGFRCASYPEEPPRSLFEPVVEPIVDFSGRSPAPEREFEIYRRFFAYESTPLNAEVEEIDSSRPFWVKETITFDASYGNEKVLAYLLLPRNADPPYQTVVFFPGSNARSPLASRGRTLPDINLVSFVPRSGRALLYPVYQGMYERYAGRWARGVSTPEAARDLFIQWSNDLQRSLDYLSARSDIDSERLAFMGLSLGAAVGPVLTAVENRFDASILIGGGFIYDFVPPEVNPVNFAPQIRIPTLMINGRYDSVFRLEQNQLPLFRAIGVTESEKRHALFETEHVPGQDEIIRETLSWLDKYLGPVQR